MSLRNTLNVMHALSYLKMLLYYTLILVNCDGKTSDLGVTNWMACLCKLCLSDIEYACLLAIVTYLKAAGT